MHTYLLDLLECPACHGGLEWTVSERSGEHIETAQARCLSCQAVYPVQDRIGVFLTPDLPRNDLWEQSGSGLSRFLAAHPEIERQLLETPLENLAPADASIRAMLLEEAGRYPEAGQAQELADRGLYTPEYRRCRDRQVEWVLDWLSQAQGPVVDLASGRGNLVEPILRRLHRPVVATDFSPRVLRADRRHWQSLGLDDRVSCLAFDARRTPFRDRAMETMTTHLGLPNIERPGDLLQELRRVVSGAFLAISHFFPEEDEADQVAIREAGLEVLLYRKTALELFSAAGWKVEVRNPCRGEARPTPPGVIMEGARIDSFPIANTMLEWCVLLAT